jgi:nucleoside-diphosphate-sugar epimerase
VAVVVTGAAGFVGSTLVPALLARGEQVIAIDRHQVPARPGLVVLTADLLDDDERVVAALGSADAVFHLAGCPGVRDARLDIAWRRHRDNVLATAAVLAAVLRDTPLVITSSSSVYGGAPGRPSAESDPLRPHGGYAESKARVELLCRQRLAAGGAVAVARPFTVVGEGQRPDMALARWIEAALGGQPLRVFGSPERTRDLTDVREAVRALIALVDRAACGPVNVGTGTARTLGELAEAVGRAVGHPVRIAVVPAGPEELAGSLADTRRLHALTGLELHTELDDVVARAVATAAAPLEVAS